jgi:predicted PurR-regulated permease PerM
MVILIVVVVVVFVFVVVVVVVVVVIITLVMTFMQSIYNYIPASNHVSRVYNVAAVMY